MNPRFKEFFFRALVKYINSQLDNQDFFANAIVGLYEEVDPGCSCGDTPNAYWVDIYYRTITDLEETYEFDGSLISLLRELYDIEV